MPTSNNFPVILCLVWQLAAGTYALPASAQSNAPTAPAAPASRPSPFLQGGAQFSDHLEPVPEALQPGSYYDDRAMAIGKQKDYWFRLPKAAAGSWHRETQVTTAERDMRTGQVIPKHKVDVTRGTDTFGMQMDKLGDVWQWQPLPYNASADGGTILRVQHMKAYHLYVTSPNSAQTYNEYLEIVVDKNTGKVMSCNQLQALGDITVRGNVLRRNATIRRFDGRGRMLSEATAISDEPLEQPFSPINTGPNGTDLRKSLINFLRQNGMENRVPEG